MSSITARPLREAPARVAEQRDRDHVGEHVRGELDVEVALRAAQDHVEGHRGAEVERADGRIEPHVVVADREEITEQRDRGEEQPGHRDTVGVEVAQRDPERVADRRHFRGERGHRRKQRAVLAQQARHWLGCRRCASLQ
ncbi:MAG: hypothetical protein M5U08_16405 [Burkholderiales bacterium]|nr:hypothetical protein [Burkholderiales bacterium]